MSKSKKLSLEPDDLGKIKSSRSRASLGSSRKKDKDRTKKKDKDKSKKKDKTKKKEVSASESSERRGEKEKGKKVKGKKHRVRKMTDDEIERYFNILLSGQQFGDREEYAESTMKEKRSFVERNWDLIENAGSAASEKAKKGSKGVSGMSKSGKRSEGQSVQFAESETPKSHVKALTAAEASLRDVRKFERDFASQNTRQWTSDFISAGGIEALGQLLAKTESVRGKTRDEISLATKLVEIITQLMRDTRSTLNALVSSPGNAALKDICAGSDSNIPSVKSGVCQILAVICTAQPDLGQPRVIEALQYYAYRNKQMRFEHLVLTLRYENDPDVLSSTLALINAIINVISDINERITLRNELYSLGMEKALLNFKEDESLDENTYRQVEAFFSDLEQDQEEFTEFVADLNDKFSDLDTSNPKDVFGALLKRINGLEYLKKPLSNILKELLVFPTDKSRGFKQWLVVDKLCHHLKANADEFHIDPVNTINLEELYVEINNTSNVEEELSNLYVQSSTLKNKYSALKTKFDRNRQALEDVDGLIEKERLALKAELRDKLNDKIEAATHLQLVEVQQLRKEIEAKNEEIKKKDSSMAEAFEKFQAELEKKNKTIKELNVELDQFDDDLDEELSKQKEKFNEERKKIISAMEKMKNDLEKKDRDISSLQSQMVEVSQEKIKEITNEIREDFRQRIQVEKEKSIARIKEVEEEADSKYQRLLNSQTVDHERDITREHRKYEDIIEQLREEKLQRDQDIDKLQSKINQFKEDLETKKFESQRKNQELSETTKDLEISLNEKIKEIIDLKEVLTKSRESSKQKMQNLKKTNRVEIDKLNDEHEEVVSNLQNKVTKLEFEVQRLENENVADNNSEILEVIKQAAAEERKKMSNTIIELERELDLARQQGEEMVIEKTRLLEVEVIKLERKMTEVVNQKDLLEDELSKLESTHDKEKKEIGENLISLRAAYTEANFQLEKSQKENASLLKQLESGTTNFGGNYNSTLMSQINDLGEENTTLQEKIKYLESKTSVTHYADLESRLSNLTKANIEAKSELKVVLGELNDIKAGKTHMTNTIESLTKRIKELEKDLESYNQVKISKLELEKNLSVALTQKAELETLIDGRTLEEFESLTKKITRLTKRVGESDVDAFQELESSLTTLSSEQENLTNQLSLHLKEHNTLIKNYERYTTETTQEIEKLQLRLNETQEEIANLTKVVDDVTERNQELSSGSRDVEVQKHKSEKLQNLFDEQSEKMSELMVKIAKLEDQNDELLDSQKELEERLEDLEIHGGGDRNEFNLEHREENEKLTQKLVNMQLKIDNIQVEKASLEKELTELSKYATLHHQLEKEITDLKKKLKAAQSQASNITNISTVNVNTTTPAVTVVKTKPAPPPPVLVSAPPPPPIIGGPAPPPPVLVSSPPPPPIIGGPGAPPPPPPPGGLGGPPPPGRAAAFWRGPQPTVKVKQFNWSKLPQKKVNNTIFKSLDPNTITLDTDTLQSLFCVKKVEKKKKIEDKPKQKETKLSLVDPKALQNVGIFLSSFKQTPEAIVEAIYTFNLDILSEEVMFRLNENLPDEDSINKIIEWLGANPENTLDKLETVDNYFMTLNDIEHLNIRMNTMVYVITFQSKINEVSEPLNTYHSVVNDFRDQSVKFNALIEIILAVGNFLNSGTSRGNCPGFSLRSLTKLRDTKSVDGKRNLLDYVVEYIEDSNPEILEIVNALTGVKAAARYSFQGVKDDMNELKRGMETCESQIPIVEKSKKCKYDVFYSAMPIEINECRLKYEEAMEMVEITENEFKKILSDYGEDEKTKASEFFGIIKDFVTMIEEAITGNEKRRVQLAAALKKEEIERKNAEKRVQIENRRNNKTDSPGEDESPSRVPTSRRGQPGTRRPKGTRPGRPGPGGPRGRDKRVEDTVDDLFDNLKTGTAFQSRTLMRKDTLSAKKKQKITNNNA